MKKSTIILMNVSLLIAIGMISIAFIFNKDVKTFLLIFFAVGTGVGLLRLFVNSNIKKMKGKKWTTKVLFFTVLLGLGIPFQNWFRKEVLLSMDSAYLVSSITIMVVGAVFMTTFFSFISTKRAARSLAE